MGVSEAMKCHTSVVELRSDVAEAPLAIASINHNRLLTAIEPTLAMVCFDMKMSQHSQEQCFQFFANASYIHII